MGGRSGTGYLVVFIVMGIAQAIRNIRSRAMKTAADAALEPSVPHRRRRSVGGARPETDSSVTGASP
jgi:hypothetical protein